MIFCVINETHWAHRVLVNSRKGIDKNRNHNKNKLRNHTKWTVTFFPIDLSSKCHKTEKNTVKLFFSLSQLVHRKVFNAFIKFCCVAKRKTKQKQNYAIFELRLWAGNISTHHKQPTHSDLWNKEIVFNKILHFRSHITCKLNVETRWVLPSIGFDCLSFTLSRISTSISVVYRLIEN